MIFPLQNNNLMFSLELLPDLVQTQVRETISGVSFWYKWSPNPSLAHGGGDAQGFQRTSYSASTPYREPTWRNANDGGKD